MTSVPSRRFSARRIASLVAVGLLGGPIGSAEAAQYELRLVPPTAGFPFTAPIGINEEGIIVGYGGPEAFSPFSVPIRVDSDGALTGLDGDEPNFGFARGIDDAGGAIVGEYGFRPQLWAGDRRITLQVPVGYFSVVARDLSEGGLVVGSFADYDDALPPSPVGPRPCFWPDAGSAAVPMRVLFRPKPTGLATAINDRGQVAGSVPRRSRSTTRG